MFFQAIVAKSLPDPQVSAQIFYFKAVSDFLVLPIFNHIKLLASVTFKFNPISVRDCDFYHRGISFERLIGYSTAINKKKPEARSRLIQLL